MSESTMSQPTESSVRAEVRAWLQANWSPDYGLVEWRTKLIESGWGAPHWPREWYGRGLPVNFTPIVDEEFARIGAVGVAKAGIRTLAAATILDHGTDLHKEKFLRRILTGEDTWCQLFSEPGSGSDMAGAVTRADQRGNQWVINGQKVWTTSAHKAHWGLLLARANWDVAKHKGLAYFVLDMKQPGVQVHPLKQMNGHASFNQVFFTDADRRTRDDGVRRGRRLDGGDHDPDARAPRRRRPAQLGAGVRPQRPHLRGGAGRDRHHDGAVQVVSAARRPRRPCDGARPSHRQDQRSGDPPGDRQAPDHVQGRRMDRAACACRAGTGPAAGPGRLARQAGVEPRRRARRRGFTPISPAPTRC